jgi:MFS family permease
MLVTSAFAGVLLDRLPRKILLVADNGLRGLFLGIIPLLAWLDLFSISVVVVLMLLSGGLSAITRVGNQAILPNLVERDQLGSANSFIQISWQTAYLAGPAMGGVSTALVGAPATLLINAGTFWIFAVLIASIPRRSFQPPQEQPSARREDAENGEGTWASFRLGLSFLISRKGLLTVALTTLFFNLVYGPLEPALPVFVDGDLGSGPRVLGYLWTALSAGMIAGTAAWAKVQPRWAPWTLGAVIMMAWGLINVFLALTREVPLAILAMFGAGFVFGPYNVAFSTYEQQVIPDSLRGRVLGTITSLTAPGLPLGQLIGGWAVAGLGATTTIVAAGVACMLTAAALLLFSSGLPYEGDGKLYETDRE